jgi:hypothetical protein
MKKYLTLSLAGLLNVGALSVGAFAQGLVTFANTPTTLISITQPGGPPAAFSASPVGSYYFGLLTAPTAAGPFNFTGAYATNTAGAGRLGPASNTQAVAGWAIGETLFYEVAGWSANLGHDWSQGWLSGQFDSGGFFGLSSVGSGTAGGPSGGVPAPAFPLFGGAGLTGLVLYPAYIPEPTGVGLWGLGAAAFLIFRRLRP